MAGRKMGLLLGDSRFCARNLGRTLRSRRSDTLYGVPSLSNRNAPLKRVFQRKRSGQSNAVKSRRAAIVDATSPVKNVPLKCDRTAIQRRG
jgi:hypothetical protein